MSNKYDAIKKAVFYAHEKPDLLADILVGNVADVASSVSISGVDSITIPLSSSVTSEYTASLLNQYGDPMTGTVNFSLKASVTGVSLSSGTVTVASTCTASSFTLVATSGTKSTEKTVTLIKRVATTVTIQGEDSITIPSSDSTTEDYTSKVYDQFEAEMSGVSATFTLKESVTGVSMLLVGFCFLGC